MDAIEQLSRLIDPEGWEKHDASEDDSEKETFRAAAFEHPVCKKMAELGSSDPALVNDGRIIFIDDFIMHSCFGGGIPVGTVMETSGCVIPGTDIGCGMVIALMTRDGNHLVQSEQRNLVREILDERPRFLEMIGSHLDTGMALGMMRNLGAVMIEMEAKKEDYFHPEQLMPRRMASPVHGTKREMIKSLKGHKNGGKWKGQRK